MGNELTKAEIAKRMQDWRDMKVLYDRAKVRVTLLEEELHLSKELITLLKERVALLEKENMEMRTQITELQEWVFKRKKVKKDDEDKSPPTSGGSRSAASYKRELPKQEEITGRKRWLLTEDACKCGGALEKSFAVFYEEEIPVLQLKKEVVEHRVEKGYCKKCRKSISAKPIPGSPVVLGEQVTQPAVELTFLFRFVNLFRRKNPAMFSHINPCTGTDLCPIKGLNKPFCS